MLYFIANNDLQKAEIAKKKRLEEEEEDKRKNSLDTSTQPNPSLLNAIEHGIIGFLDYQ